MPGWAKEVLVQPFDWPHDPMTNVHLGTWEKLKVPLLERGVMSDGRQGYLPM
jgi:hypothetical protein